MRVHTRSVRRRFHVLAAATLVASPLVTSPASATVRTWLPTSGNWSTPANWSGGVAPTATDDAGILGATGLSARTCNYDYTGPAVTLLFVRIDASVATGSPNSLTQPANTLHTVTEQVGISDKGLYSLSGGVNTVDGLLTMGINAGSRGTFSVSGTGSLSAGSIMLGDSGFGTLSLGGGSISAGNITVANNGAGRFDHSAGQASITNLLRIGVGSISTGTYNLSGTGFLNTGSLIAGDLGSGTVIQSGGQLSAFGPGIRLGNGAGGRGVYALSGGNITNTSQVLVGNNGLGTLNVSGTGHIFMNQASSAIQVGVSGTGTVNHSGGTIDLTGILTLGANASGKGTYNLTGPGVLTADGITIGSQGAGTMNQSDGELRFGNLLQLGSSSSSSGT